MNLSVQTGQADHGHLSDPGIQLHQEDQMLLALQGNLSIPVPQKMCHHNNIHLSEKRFMCICDFHVCKSPICLRIHIHVQYCNLDHVRSINAVYVKYVHGYRDSFMGEGKIIINILLP